MTPQEIKLIALSLMAACALTCLAPARDDAGATAFLPALAGAPYAGAAGASLAGPALPTLPAAGTDDQLREALLLSAGAGWLMWPANKVMEQALEGREAPARQPVARAGLHPSSLKEASLGAS